MKQRYNIIETYNGLFDEERIIACTNDLMHAVRIVKMLNIANDNPCYDYDFIKINKELDKIYDFYPGKSLLDIGQVIDCKNYKEFKEKTNDEDYI